MNNLDSLEDDLQAVYISKILDLSKQISYLNYEMMISLEISQNGRENEECKFSISRCSDSLALIQHNYKSCLKMKTEMGKKLGSINLKSINLRTQNINNSRHKSLKNNNITSFVEKLSEIL